ncbi:MAG: three-Cys-motif partner protein TcmP [Candidatus Hydrogenedentes bacterium]|nr:three-Cys-motif partner protein TcmP [Candidatus Hydrogenedentota bacterium]
MADDFDTIWEAKRHTLAKHQILQSYLGAWVAILGREVSNRSPSTKELRVFDAFAGPGVYENGEAGSPVLAINTILNHEAELKRPVRLTFIEEDAKRCATLRLQIAALQEKIDACSSIQSVKCFDGDCISLLDEWIDKIDSESKELGPAFFFLDQFGYSKVPMSMIQKIMRHNMCECLLFLNWSRFGVYLSDKTKWPTFDKAFGGDEWRAALEVPSQDSARTMQASFKKALQDKAKVKYVWHFAMCDDRNQLTHWLFFCTNHIRGLEEMKKAMRKTDATGAFSFSDRVDPAQFQLLDYYDETALREDIRKRFRGETVSVSEIRHFVTL